MPGAVAVRGLADLQKAFRGLSKDLGNGVREALEESGEPVRQEASRLAQTEISGMRRSNMAWAQMRVGVTRHSVYVAPVQRGVKSAGLARRYKRRQFFETLLGKALEPALDSHIDQVEDEMLDALDRLFRVWERA